MSVLAIHIEDDEQWRVNIQRFVLQHSGSRFQQFISSSSIEEVQHLLKSRVGPIVLIMDLRLGNGHPNYSGYHWLLEELDEFVHNNASTSVFIISGQLHEGIHETLVRKGIPQEHIYNKGTWYEQRTHFLTTLRTVVDNMEATSLKHITKGKAGEMIDPYLLHSFEVSKQTWQAPPVGTAVLPMLVQAKGNSWNFEKIPDLTVQGHIDNIFLCQGSVRSVVALERDPYIINIEASRSALDSDCHQSVPFVKADIVHTEFQEKGDKAIVGIIDSGIDILHHAFRDAAGQQTRILAVWDQRDSTGTPPKGFHFGTEHTKNDLNSYISTGVVPKQLKVGALDHGTHVASIAAGRDLRQTNGNSPEEFAGGIAPEAYIVFVIPDMEVSLSKPHSLGYSISHLQALTYIKNIAKESGLPVVINVSQGMNAGAHDGTSLLEKGFDKITGNGEDPGIMIVKSAGNERGWNGHARLVMFSNQIESLSWLSKKIYRNEDNVELWFRAGDSFKFRLKDPKGNSTEWVSSENQSAHCSFQSGNECYLTLNRFDRDNGDSRLIVTVKPGSSSSIAEGEWELEVQSDQVRSTGEIHAWMERHNSRAVAFTKHLEEGITLSIPGTARHVIAVGAISSNLPYRLANFSSYGPTRDGREKPELVAPGEDIFAAASNQSKGIQCMSGTSMAAPHVTGGIALLFSYRAKQCRDDLTLQQFNTAQVQAALTQFSQNYDGKWHPGFGFGVLNIERLLKEFGGLGE